MIYRRQNYANVRNATFQINSTKLYAPVVTLSINNNIKFSENLKQGFKITISWNKYRLETTTQPKNNNLDYVIDPAFQNVNRFFFHLFKTFENGHVRNFFVKYYMSLVEIKDLLTIKYFLIKQEKSKKQTRSLWKNCQNVTMNIQQEIY